tara:strand:+ start:1263 stop:1532 length:270 start_codon:yes stop_codon:yes gene_type:complete
MKDKKYSITGEIRDLGVEFTALNELSESAIRLIFCTKKSIKLRKKAIAVKFKMIAILCELYPELKDRDWSFNLDHEECSLTIRFLDEKA